MAGAGPTVEAFPVLLRRIWPRGRFFWFRRRRGCPFPLSPARRLLSGPFFCLLFDGPGLIRLLCHATGAVGTVGAYCGLSAITQSAIFFFLIGHGLCVSRLLLMMGARLTVEAFPILLRRKIQATGVFGTLNAFVPRPPFWLCRYAWLGHCPVLSPLAAILADRERNGKEGLWLSVRLLSLNAHADPECAPSLFTVEILTIVKDSACVTHSPLMPLWLRATRGKTWWPPSRRVGG
jgi:hypothetical protein